MLPNTSERDFLSHKHIGFYSEKDKAARKIKEKIPGKLKA